MTDTVPVYTRVSRPTHAWLKDQARKNAVTIAMIVRLLAERETGKELEIRSLVVLNDE